MPQDHNRNRTFLSHRYQAEEDHFDLMTFQSSIDLLHQDLSFFYPKDLWRIKSLNLNRENRWEKLISPWMQTEKAMFKFGQ